MAKHYKTSLNAERTYNIINPPLVHIPLEKVVPFFLHVSLGMFKKTVTSFNTACRALDKLVLDPNIRNSATVEHLSVKLEEGLGKLEVARLRVGEQETAVMIAQERLVEIGEILGPIYAHWIRKDAVSIVSKRVSLEVLEEFRAQKEIASQITEQLHVEQKHLSEAQKQLSELNKAIANIQKEIKNVIGPIESRSKHCLEWELELKGNVWWGDYIGPDITKFFSLKKVMNGEETVEDAKPKFQVLVDTIRKHVIDNIDAISLAELVPGETLTNASQMLEEYLNLWKSMGSLHFATKHAGEQTPERLKNLYELQEEFVPRYQALCVQIDKEGPPKFHVQKRHTMGFIATNRCSWNLSEEAIESLHHVISFHAERNARLPGEKHKLEGTMRSFVAQNDFKIASCVNDTKATVQRRSKVAKNKVTGEVLQVTI